MSWICARVCACVHVRAPPPSYCLPILRKRQKAHLDLVGWKVGPLRHRALLVNGGLLQPPSPQTTGYPQLLPPLNVLSQQIFETLQVNHKTESLPPPLQTESGGVADWGGGVHKRSWCSEQAAAEQLIINCAPPREQTGRLERSQQEVSPSVWSRDRSLLCHAERIALQDF